MLVSSRGSLLGCGGAAKNRITTASAPTRLACDEPLKLVNSYTLVRSSP